ncbi:arginase family protein [Sphingomonas jatrophae]|uniref:Agmatinase n=1 Tax=Sphingomonas jatrophae TaxID=1166337 RepID=A0A1I6K3Q2_9SPHN|nr:arginase family protein [Sphingomonas jatrophae]SFR85895.1 agmatinase [Sphingomonas jatrophae]
MTFAKLPAASLDDLTGAKVVIYGAAEASPYASEPRSHSHDAPAVLREVSEGFAGQLWHYDFDTDRTLFPDPQDRRGCVDAGDVPTDPADAEGNRARITAATAAILKAGAVPILLGGDDSVPIPFLAGFEGHGPIHILQVDAHVDWADVIEGNPYGYGSPMRRASEYPWVAGMVQVGARGLGSGDKGQHDDARAWGSHIVTAYQLHAESVEAALAHIPEGATVVVSLDCDGIDPAVLPAVNMPTPGGVTYEDMIRLLRGIADRGRLGGLALVEYTPQHDDPRRLSGMVAARIAAAAMALALD